MATGCGFFVSFLGISLRWAIERKRKGLPPSLPPFPIRGLSREEGGGGGRRNLSFLSFPCLLVASASIARQCLLLLLSLPPSVSRIYPYPFPRQSHADPRPPPPPPGKRFDDGTLCSSFPFPLPFLSAEIRKETVHSVLAFLFSIHEKQIASLGLFSRMLFCWVDLNE